MIFTVLGREFTPLGCEFTPPVVGAAAAAIPKADVPKETIIEMFHIETQHHSVKFAILGCETHHLSVKFTTLGCEIHHGVLFITTLACEIHHRSAKFTTLACEIHPLSVKLTTLGCEFTTLGCEFTTLRCEFTPPGAGAAAAALPKPDKPTETVIEIFGDEEEVAKAKLMIQEVFDKAVVSMQS